MTHQFVTATVIGGLISCMAMVLGHQFRRHPLQPPWTYVWGTSWLIVAWLVWLALVDGGVTLAGELPKWVAFVGFFAVAAAGGLGTVGCYAFDWLVEIIDGRTDATTLARTAAPELSKRTLGE